MAAWKLVLGVGLVAVGAYFASPGAAAKDADYSAIGIFAVVTLLVAMRAKRPAVRRGWYLLAIGNLCFVLGDGVYDLYLFGLHRPVPFPSIADALYLTGYPFVFAGVWQLVRSQANTARESYADALIVSIGALAISWNFLMGGEAHAVAMTTFAKLVTLSYPVMDLAVLFVVIRGLFFGNARQVAHKLLAGSILSMLVADFVYDVLVQHGSYSTGNPVDAGWLVAYVLLAAAAAHPSAAEPRADVAIREGVDRRRVPVLALAGLTPPVILLCATLSHAAVDVPVLAGLSIAMLSVVTIRMWWLFARFTDQARLLQAALTERGALEDDLRRQAFHDALTGLANRALLRDRVDHALAGASRRTGVVALCFCDLDGFKTINDSLGHGVGDEVLTSVSRRLTLLVRPGDTVARFGGDEFAVLMEHLDRPEDTAVIAQRIVQALSQPTEIAGRSIATSVSVGVAIAGDYATTERLLSDADAAMYEAKTAGKNCYRIFEPSMHERAVEQLAIRSAFNDAFLHD